MRLGLTNTWWQTVIHPPSSMADITDQSKYSFLLNPDKDVESLSTQYSKTPPLISEFKHKLNPVCHHWSRWFYRHTLFYGTLLYHSSQMLYFLFTNWRLVVTLRWASLWVIFFSRICSLCVSLSRFVNSHSISNIIVLFVIVICVVPNLIILAFF